MFERWATACEFLLTIGLTNQRIPALVFSALVREYFFLFQHFVDSDVPVMLSNFIWFLLSLLLCPNVYSTSSMPYFPFIHTISIQLLYAQMS